MEPDPQFSEGPAPPDPPVRQTGALQGGRVPGVPSAAQCASAARRPRRCTDGGRRGPESEAARPGRLGRPRPTPRSRSRRSSQRRRAEWRARATSTGAAASRGRRGAQRLRPHLSARPPSASPPASPASAGGSRQRWARPRPGCGGGGAFSWLGAEAGTVPGKRTGPAALGRASWTAADSARPRGRQRRRWCCSSANGAQPRP